MGPYRDKWWKSLVHVHDEHAEQVYTVRHMYSVIMHKLTCTQYYVLYDVIYVWIHLSVVSVKKFQISVISGLTPHLTKKWARRGGRLNNFNCSEARFALQENTWQHRHATMQKKQREDSHRRRLKLIRSIRRNWAALAHARVRDVIGRTTVARPMSTRSSRYAASYTQPTPTPVPQSNAPPWQRYVRMSV